MASGSIGLGLLSISLLIGFSVLFSGMSLFVMDFVNIASESTDKSIEIKNIEFEIVEVDDNMVVVENTGSEGLAVDDFNVFLDGFYEEPEDVNVIGASSSDVLYSGERVELMFSTDFNRVKISGVYGISDSYVS